MKLTFIFAGTIIILLLIQISEVEARIVKDQYIIKVKKGESSDSVAMASKIKPHRIYSKVFNGFSATIPPQALEALKRNPKIEAIEPVQTIFLDPTISSVQESATWGIDRIDQRSLPRDLKYNYQYSGAGVNAYIIDTGIKMDHSEFEGRASLGFDAFNDGQNGNDCQGHGTHVAATVGGKLYGVAKEVKLFAIRALNCTGSGTSDGLLAGLEWIALNNVGPAVANMSLGGSKSSLINEAVAELTRSGVSVVVAAGNSNVDACSASPASALEAITVAASGSTDARASFSNYGPCVDVFAPGVSITSASIASTTASVAYSGTSMSSPHVAGVAALYLDQNPAFSPAEVQTAIKSSSTKGIITNSNTTNNHLVFSFYEPDEVIPGPVPEPDPVPEITLPMAPSNLSAALSGKSVKLSWMDQANNEEGFEIHRSSNGGASYSIIARMAANSIAYYDSNIVSRTTYIYKVRAFNSKGGSSFSNSVSITPVLKTGGRRK